MTAFFSLELYLELKLGLTYFSLAHKVELGAGLRVAPCSVGGVAEPGHAQSYRTPTLGEEVVPDQSEMSIVSTNHSSPVSVTAPLVMQPLHLVPSIKVVPHPVTSHIVT